MFASLLAMLLGAQAPAAAPAPAAPRPVCTARAPIPAALAGFDAAMPVTAAAGVQGIGEAMLPIGRGVVATLPLSAQVTYPIAPSRPQGATSHGGVFAFSAPQPGRYRVALGAPAWIDVVANGAPLPSVAHGHGSDCSPVHKTVDFDLKPGRYLLQLVGSDRASLAMMIARLG